MNEYRRRFRTILISTFLVGVSSFGFADIPLAKGLDLETKIRFRVDQDSIEDEYFDLDAKLELKYEFRDIWEFRIESELDTESVRLSELWGKYSFDSWRLKAGMFENILLVDDFLSRERNYFSSDNIVSDRLKYMGWYSSGATGASFYRNAKDGERTFGFSSHAFFHPASAEFQIDAGGYWAYDGEDSFLGGIVAYYPFLVHDTWFNNMSYVQRHNFLLSVYAANFRDDRPLVYKAEIVVASNLIDPVGFIHFPSEGDPSGLFGASAFVGFPIARGRATTTPGLRSSYLMHSLGEPRSNDMEFVLTGTFQWSGFLTLNGGIGLGTSTYYDTEWVTALELLWDLEVSVRI